jgi:hypothetical protein
MAERDHTGARKARVNIPNSPACGQWETLLADALDGLLRPEDEAVFSSHMATCAACTVMFEEARRGREWLEFLAPEPEVPAYLLDRILVETGHGLINAGKLAVAGGDAGAGNVLAMPPVWQRPGFAARMRRFAEPRLLMTAAMAFFSIALTLSLVGVRFDSFRMGDLRPATVRSVLEKRIMTASTPIVRYYDHLRFVYEVESRMKELRRSTQGERESEEQNKQKNQPSGSSGEGESHHKDGGTRLNPKEAPQQTVNPPASLWSGGDALQARLEQPLGLESGHLKLGYLKSRNRESNDVSTTMEVSGLLRAESFKSSVSAVGEGSKPCSV